MFTLDDFIKKLLSLGVNEKLAYSLIDEYKKIKITQFLNDYKRCIAHAARFSELVLALIKGQKTGQSVNLDRIYFDRFYREIRSYSKSSAEDEILTLAIPDVARSIYTLRSKKDVIHFKTIDPNFIDSVYCVTACDWILVQLALLLLKISEKEAYELTNSILRKKIPLIEEFEDGSLQVLHKNLKKRDEILLILYYRYPRRVKNSELQKAVRTNVSVYLPGLERERIIHRTKEGSKLTQLGIKYVEEQLLPIILKDASRY